MATNLRQFIRLLQQHNDIVEIAAPVDSDLELAEIHRRIAAVNGPALFFKNVKGSSFPVATNLFGTTQRVSLAFQNKPEEIIQNLIHLLTRDFPPSPKTLWQQRSLIRKMLSVGLKRKSSAPVLEQKQATPNLELIPMLKSWPMDGGHFITLPLVYTQPTNGGAPNLGMYRMQRYDSTSCGLHWQIAKGGGYHYHQAEASNLPLPVNVFIGGPPALMLSAITPLPENVPELLLCSLLQGEKLRLGNTPHNDYPVVAESEFALIGHAKPNKRRLEGPFGDHYGYYSLEHEFPVFECQAVYHRKDAIYPATVVGKPRQEDFYLGNYLQKMLSPLFPVVMPGVKSLWSYGETGFHSLSAAVVRERYYRECMASAFRILGEGQLSLTKFLLVTDQSIDLQDFKTTLTTVLERFRPETDLFIFANLSLDTLDYTGPELNKGSRGIMLGVGEKVRDLPRVFHGATPEGVSKLAVFSPGCLVVEVAHTNFEDILKQESLANWPLVIVVDSIAKSLKSTDTFLWTVFTRFEPAADIHARSTTHRHHLCYSGPVLIDARMKPNYPAEVLCDEQTAELVTKRWGDYFPQGMPMGDSMTAHVC
ncbi:MAG: UbiD family decarboxylase [Chlamydiales bacterium]|nr:UbiD family decarboxylase [Chlamydiales bacterium]